MKPGATAFTVMLSRSDFDRDRAGEPDESRLRRNVIRLPGVPRLGDDGRNIDDAARALFEHRAERLLDAEVRAGEVGLQHRVPIVELHAQRERVARDRGVVDENVEPAHFLECVLEAVFHLRGVGHVHRDRERFATRSSDFLRERGELIRAARGDHDFGARLGQRERRGAPNALGRAGNQSDFIFEREHDRERTYRTSNSSRKLHIGFPTRRSSWYRKVMRSVFRFRAGAEDTALSQDRG